MLSSRWSIDLRRTVALVLIPLVAMSCYSWRAAEVTLQVVEAEHQVRVTTQDSTRYVLRGARIVTDTLRGIRGKDSVAVALREVTRMDVRRISSGKTVGLVLGLGLIVLLAAEAYRDAWEDVVIPLEPGRGRVGP